MIDKDMFSIPTTKQIMMVLAAMLIAGTVTLIGLAMAVIVGTCYGIAYLLSILLAHTSSTQMLLMFVVGIVLYHVGKKAVRSASLFRFGAHDYAE